VAQGTPARADATPLSRPRARTGQLRLSRHLHCCFVVEPAHPARRLEGRGEDVSVHQPLLAEDLIGRALERVDHVLGEVARYVLVHVARAAVGRSERHLVADACDDLLVADARLLGELFDEGVGRGHVLELHEVLGLVRLVR
jgi:hypothetical protein